MQLGLRSNITLPFRVHPLFRHILLPRQWRARQILWDKLQLVPQNLSVCLSTYLLALWMCLEPRHRLLDCLTHRRGFHAKCLLELARINNKWFFKFIHHFNRLFCLGNKQAAYLHHCLAHGAHLRLNAHLRRDHLDHLALSHTRMIIRHVPRLSVRFTAFS
jgi:hypothetical protein